MHILVTGAQGCIGSWVVKCLLDRKLDVTVYDLEPSPARLAMIAPREAVGRVRIETGAIEDTSRIKALVKNSGVTHIVHLAAQLMPYCQANPVAGGMINVIGTLNVFEAARDAGRPVRVVYASTAAVWGPEDSYGSDPLSEEDALKPSTHYGVFKQANEGNARVFYSADGISSIGLRPWTVYGPGRDRGLTADPTIALKALAMRVPFKMRVTGFMDLQYVYDIGETFVRCLLSDVEGAHVFNLAGDVIDMNDFIQLLDTVRPGAAKLISTSGKPVPVAYRMDASRLHSHVPGIPKTSLESGVAETLEIYERLHAEGRLDPSLPT